MRLLLCIVILSVFCMSMQAETYTSKYDNINVDHVLGNKRLLAAYIKCMTDRGRCTPEGRELKSHITEALKSGCEKCTDKQRNNIRKVLKHLIKNELDAWKELVETYDPENVYSVKYERELGEINS